MSGHMWPAAKLKKNRCIPGVDAAPGPKKVFQYKFFYWNIFCPDVFKKATNLGKLLNDFCFVFFHDALQSRW